MFNLFKSLINIEEFNFYLPSLWRKKIDRIDAKILFIDDEDFPIVNNLQSAGWSVERIKDAKNLQDDAISKAHIIFVDFKGVGRYLSKNDEGIGLIRAIKEAYGKRKRVILYSGYGRFNLRMNTQAADNQLSKNSDTYEFISMIESELKKIR